MNTHDLAYLISLDPISRCKGVVAADENIVLNEKDCAVVNTENSDKIGQHWVLLFRDKGLKLFCPLGQDTPTLWPEAERINYVIYQSENSRTCGLHCVYVAYLYARGLGVNEIVSYYKQSVRENDKLVKQFALSLVR